MTHNLDKAKEWLDHADNGKQPEVRAGALGFASYLDSLDQQKKCCEKCDGCAFGSLHMCVNGKCKCHREKPVDKWEKVVDFGKDGMPVGEVIKKIDDLEKPVANGDHSFLGRGSGGEKPVTVQICRNHHDRCPCNKPTEKPVVHNEKCKPCWCGKIHCHCGTPQPPVE